MQKAHYFMSMPTLSVLQLANEEHLDCFQYFDQNQTARKNAKYRRNTIETDIIMA